MSAPDPSVLERAGFHVTENTPWHWTLRGHGLHVDYWPTVGKFQAFGKVFHATVESFLSDASTGRIKMPATDRAVCNRCGGSIWWVLSGRGKWMPLNADGGSHFAHCRRTQ